MDEQHLKVTCGGGPASHLADAAVAVFKSSKKSKPKKTPQRGLGVSQLEKLRRLEDLQMNCGSASSPTRFPPPPAATAAPPVHDSIASVSAINEQQQHPPPLLPLLPLPGVFPLLWDRGDPKVE